MTVAKSIIATAGPVKGLPFFLLVVLFFLHSDVKLTAKDETVLSFQEFESNCIDLAHYDKKTKALTVRFVNRNSTRFYRYTNVSVEVWKKLNSLNETGGVGEYLNETVVQHPEKYPFKELTISAFKTIPKKKKAGNSK